MFFICLSSHKLLFITLYIALEGAFGVFGVMKNDFSNLQCRSL